MKKEFIAAHGDFWPNKVCHVEGDGLKSCAETKISSARNLDGLFRQSKFVFPQFIIFWLGYLTVASVEINVPRERALKNMSTTLLSGSLDCRKMLITAITFRFFGIKFTIEDINWDF